MNETTLVVGGAGYIGSHVVLALKEHGFPVIVLDDLSSGCKENLFRDVTFYQGDMRNRKDLERVFSENRIRHVVHLAALKAAGDSMEDPSTYAKHNISGTVTLLDVCLEAEIKSFIFSSSAAVYGDPVYTPLDETHPLNPANFYGFTKLEIERILDWYQRLKGLRFACLRYFNAAGYDPGNRIRGLERNPRNLIPVVMETATKQRQSFDVYGTDYPTRDGSCIRDYIHVSDLAEAHVSAIEYLFEHEKLVCNLGTGSGTSVLEIINAFQNICGEEVKYEVVDRRPGDPAELMAGAQLAKELLGWEPVYSSIHNILDSTWAAYCGALGFKD